LNPRWEGVKAGQGEEVPYISRLKSCSLSTEDKEIQFSILLANFGRNGNAHVIAEVESMGGECSQEEASAHMWGVPAEVGGTDAIDD
jgi:hypothetical protein